MKILISRVDNIGDVILSLPLCGWIKRNIHESEVHFLCQSSMADLPRMSDSVDFVHEWAGTLPNVDAIMHLFPKKEIALAAKKAKIKLRVGTSHRLIHWTTCNKLLNFSRIKGDLHEAQLNFKLLAGLWKGEIPELNEMVEYVDWNSTESKSEFLSKNAFNLILHIKSGGSAKEWKSANYLILAKKLAQHKFNITLTGTSEEAASISKEIPEIFGLKNVQDSMGKLSLKDLINLIGSADGLVACSTGPLHIAGVSGIHALGLYPKKRPMHAGRWSPIGRKSEFIEEANESKDRFLDIPPEAVLERIESWTS